MKGPDQVQRIEAAGVVEDVRTTEIAGDDGTAAGQQQSPQKKSRLAHDDVTEQSSSYQIVKLIFTRPSMQSLSLSIMANL